MGCRQVDQRIVFRPPAASANGSVPFAPAEHVRRPAEQLSRLAFDDCPKWAAARTDHTGTQHFNRDPTTEPLASSLLFGLCHRSLPAALKIAFPCGLSSSRVRAWGLRSQMHLLFDAFDTHGRGFLTVAQLVPEAPSTSDP